MSGLIEGMHHLNMKAKDVAEFDALVRFYTEVLGLAIVKQWESTEKKGVMLSPGNCLLEIALAPEAGRGTGSIDHIAFLVADVPAAVEAVRAAGFPITKEPFDAELPTDPPCSLQIAFCTGPIGETIEFYKLCDSNTK